MVGAVLIAAMLQAQGPAGPVVSGRSGALDVRPPRIEADVTIDGKLDEPVWRRAALLNGFSQFTPQDGVPAADSTQVLVWYSPTAIYFGIRAFQPAGTVRATLADRDKITDNDNVQLLIGTFHDRRQATVLMLNPFGVQADGILVEKGALTGGGFTGQLSAREAPDLSPDYVFDSKGRLTDYGYEIEVRVPFKSLKYQSAAVQSWDFNVIRQVQYTGYEDSWAPAKHAAASFLAQGGTLTGLTELHRGLVMDLTPEATERIEGAPATAPAKPGAWQLTTRDPALGATVRWGITNNLTLNATANPDFSQVEADATPAVLDPRAAISFPEKRPFFLDGLEQFTVPNSLIYTRAIVQPLGAAKLTGKVAGTDLAILAAEDAASASTSKVDHPLFGIVRLQHDLGDQSRIGLALTDREDGSNANRVAEVDGRVVWNTIHSLQYQLAGAATKSAAGELDGPLWDLHYAGQGRSLIVRSLFTGVSDRFFTTSGFLSRNGQVHANVNPRYTWFFDRGSLLEQFSFDYLMDWIWNYSNWLHSGDARDKKLHFSFQGQSRGGWSANAAIYFESFGYDPGFYGPRYRVEVPHAGSATAKDTIPFVGSPRIYNRDWVFAVATPKLKYLTLSVTGIWGQDENFSEWSSADIWYLSMNAEVRPTDQLRITPSLAFTDYFRRTNDVPHPNGLRVSRVLIPRTKVEYQITRDLFVRVIGEYAANYSDALRDDSRTDGPLLVNRGGIWVKTTPSTSNAVRGDFLVSYRPTPGTVFYAGYDAQMTEPTSFGFNQLNRTNDAYFVKLSYLFRY